MGNVQPLLTHEPGNSADRQQGDADQDQGRAGDLQQQRPIGGQIRADQAERRAQRDEGGCKSGDEERRLAEHLELLPDGGVGARRGRAHVGDVGRHQRQHTSGRKRQQAGDERQGQVEDH